MARRNIPERDPAGYPFTGSILKIVGETVPTLAHLLALQPQPGAETLASGDFIVRYGFRYLGKPHFSIVPGIVALDYGDMLTGQEAWEFVYKKSTLHPRADIVGYRNDGQDEMIQVKYLDLAMDFDVLVYPDNSATVPLASVTAFIATEDALAERELPPDLLAHLPRYDSIADWQNNSDE